MRRRDRTCPPRRPSGTEPQRDIAGRRGGLRLPDGFRGDHGWSAGRVRKLRPPRAHAAGGGGRLRRGRHLPGPWDHRAALREPGGVRPDQRDRALHGRGHAGALSHAPTTAGPPGPRSTSGRRPSTKRPATSGRPPRRWPASRRSCARVRLPSSGRDGTRATSVTRSSDPSSPGIFRAGSTRSTHRPGRSVACRRSPHCHRFPSRSTWRSSPYLRHWCLVSSAKLPRWACGRRRSSPRASERPVALVPRSRPNCSRSPGATACASSARTASVS